MTFRRYAAERVAITALVLFLCAGFCYVCFHVIGFTPDTSQWDPDEIARLHRFEHQGFGAFLWQLVGHGSLGQSIRFGSSANGVDLNSWMGDLVPPTLSVASGALVVAMLAAIPLGLAWSRWRRVRFFGTPFVYLMFGLIQVWVGLLLSWQVGFEAGILPISGYCTFTAATSRSDCGGPVQWAYHLILPAITLGFLLAAVHTVVIRRLARGVVAAERQPTAEREDSVKAARSHMWIAYAKLVARTWFWLLGATVFTESIFNLHGLGQAAVEFANELDLAGLQAVVLFTALLTIGGWLVVDLIGAAVSPHWREL
jgi:peptide/nickel transport system permease protein